jgi:RNA polymerase sigma-70 factor (ECF subfamily)
MGVSRQNSCKTVRVAAGQGDDSTLIVAAQAGDANAFACVVNKYEWMIKAQLKRHLPERDDVDDLYQETLFEAYRSLPSFSHRGRFTSWLFQIACRVAYRHCRAIARERALIREYTQILGNGRFTPFANWSKTEDVRAILSQLAGVDRQLIEYRYIDEMEPLEIALRIGWNPTRVRVRIHRILKRLRREWTIHGV